MTEEPRRSGRATKGQYTKDRDINEETPTTTTTTKKKGRGKGKNTKNVEEEEEQEIIRCICGTYEEEEDTPRAMICCDNCEAWQHNDCMGLPEPYQPDSYFCERCRPEDHQELLQAIEQGEKAGDIAARRREAFEAEKSTKKKGAKRGRKSLAGKPETPSRGSQDVEESPATSTAAGQKRKLEETPGAGDTKNTKKVRGTPIADANGARPSPQSAKSGHARTPSRQDSRSEATQPMVEDVKELTNAVRKGAASSLVKLFTDQIKDTLKAGLYALPSGSSAQETATQIALHIEHALYHLQSGGTGEPNDAYKNHLRTISFNVKKNQALALRLLNGELTAHGLASMDARDMASEEQQRKDAAMMKEMEKQHTIIEEQGPRIRRTHKGDEYVDESRQVAAESLTSKNPIRKPSVSEQEGDAKSPDMTSPPDTTGRGGRTSSISIPSKPRPMVNPRRQSSTNFDIDKVWSNVQGSPETDGQRFGDLPQQSPGIALREPTGPGARADADIDELLKDEEVESPPYSPKESAESDGTIWRGVVNGGNLGRFHASAKHAAGATPDSATLQMTYHQLIPAEIGIGGRIQPAKADEYLCGLEYSNTSDLVVVYMPEPQAAIDADQFDKFFKYFKTKERFGVGIQHQNPAIKDIYLIPLDAGQELPTFVKKLETEFNDPAQERMLLVPIVIKNSELPHNINTGGSDGAGLIASPNTGGPVIQTPITPHEGSYDLSKADGGAISYNQPHHSRPAGTNGSQGSPQPPFQNHTYSSMPGPYANNNPTLPPTAAAQAAQKVLGDFATTPAVIQLIQQVPNAGEFEMKVVRECINENPEAAQNLEVLTKMLQTRDASSQQQHGQGP